MNQHATAEDLSAYIDDELEAPVMLRLVEHLEECPSCQERLRRTRKVVTSLRHLERAVPPPLLARAVQRRVALAPRPSRGLVERLEDRLRGTSQGSPLFFTFFLVACLAVLVYFFVAEVERSRQPRTALFVGKLPQVSAPTGEIEAVRQLGQEGYELVDGLWRQQGIEQRGADLRVDASSVDGRALLRLHPQLPTLGDRVLLRVDQMVVELYGLAAVDRAESPPAELN